jgi:hypothetical protein
MTKRGALKSVLVVTDAELEINGGNYKLQQGPALKVRGYTAANVGARKIKGGDAQPVYVLIATDIESGGGRWKVTAGEAVQITDVIGDVRGIIQGPAIPVFPVDDDGVYDPTFAV